MTNTYKMQLAPVDPATAEPVTKSLLQDVKKEFGMIANLPRVMANSPALMSTYNHGYQAFRKQGTFTKSEQEVIFLTLSRENGCDYCVAAHSIMADMQSNVPPAVTEAIRSGDLVPDAKLQALVEFTKVMLLSRGYPTQEETAAFLGAGYQEEQILEIILAIAVKTISNYTNHVFHTPLDAVFKGREYKAFKLGRSIVQFARRAVG